MVGISSGIQTPEIMMHVVQALTADYKTIAASTVITGKLAVSSFVNIGDRLTVRANGYNGTIRCIPLVDTSESCLMVYKYINMRATNADDSWLIGQTYWFNGRLSTGTPGLGMCLNISTIGTVKAPYKIITPLIYNDTIRTHGAAHVTIDDNVIITGDLSITGTITASNSNPFYIAGQVAADGTVSTSKGQIGFRLYRSAAGVYVVAPNINFGNST